MLCAMVNAEISCRDIYENFTCRIKNKLGLFAKKFYENIKLTIKLNTYFYTMHILDSDLVW